MEASAPSTRDDPTRRQIALAVLVAALGYFVDIYDLILFSIVRKESLLAIGVPESQLLDKGADLLNMQMGGMLLGGIFWGVMGDKKGRLSVLFGSIFMYSLANIANGFVTSLEGYAVLRFIAGVGLAGELGAGVTLVSELLPKETRGIGTTIIASVGLLGAGLAWLVAQSGWRTAYFVGGGLGLALLALRVGVRESGLFARLKQTEGVTRGDFFALFRKKERALRLIATTLVGIPIWYVVGILITFSPEIGKAMGMAELPNPGVTVVICYMGGAVGDLLSGLISQAMKSRKKVVFAYLLAVVTFVVAYFTVGKTSVRAFYTVSFCLGMSFGYWALFVTMASEQFGTNLRSTATTTIPNFVRGAVVPLTTLFKFLKTPGTGETHGLLDVRQSAMAVGVIALTIALVSLSFLKETFGRDLDFVET